MCLRAWKPGKGVSFVCLTFRIDMAETYIVLGIEAMF